MGAQEILARLTALGKDIGSNETIGGMERAKWTEELRQIFKMARAFFGTLPAQDQTQTLTQASEQEGFTEKTGSPVSESSQNLILTTLPSFPSLTRQLVVQMPLAEFRELEDHHPGWIQAKDNYPARPGDSMRLGFWAWIQCGLEGEAGLIVSHIKFMRSDGKWLKDGGAYIPGLGAYLRKRAWESWTPPAAMKPASAVLPKTFSLDERKRQRGKFLNASRTFTAEERAEQNLETEEATRRKLAQQAKQMGGR